ncbi:hypothetical protein ABIA16_004075 [Sinorhizobium fredii]
MNKPGDWHEIVVSLNSEGIERGMGGKPSTSSHPAPQCPRLYPPSPSKSTVER